VLVTQQMGSQDCADLNAALGAPPARRPGSWTAAVAAAEVAAAGMTVDDVREEWPVLRFLDIGAVVYQLRMVPWQIPDFTAGRYDRALRRVHREITADEHLDVRSHRFLIRAHAR